ncbi:predicted protein [Nematostella vectensis]|uniref:Kinase n=1 Tax=Nematostella vectensis TaxID=45351 RepID=A7SYC7_NEMVE|nr:predicted protein [Nematostella vectensis]|eukprot:XP_001623388.1 predicted protein [Nematostella vectensis]
MAANKCAYYDRFLEITAKTTSVLSKNQLRCFEHQVAGHGSGEKSKGMLLLEGGILLKPVQDYPRGARETGFYEYVFSSSQNDVVELRRLIPGYFGTVSLPLVKEYLQLEDMTKGFRVPCILDVKIGKICWDPLAKEDKIKRELSKSALQRKYGLRILGFKVFNPTRQEYEYFSNADGKALITDEQLLNAFVYFLSGASGCRKTSVLSKILREMESILQWWEKQRTFLIRASSLMIIYEGENRTMAEERASDKGIDLLHEVKVKMIDFAHAFECSEKDDNFLEALKELMDLISKC